MISKYLLENIMPHQPSDRTLILFFDECFSILDDWEVITGCQFSMTSVPSQPQTAVSSSFGLISVVHFKFG